MTTTPQMFCSTFDEDRLNESAVGQLLIGNAPAMRQLRSLICRVAQTSLPVLIEGPTGSGKELVARAIHAASGRSGGFVPFNVAAVPETLFENTLFGHVKGAFTGATTGMPGFLMEAHRGTCFFDEIGALPPALQPKLLRAIDSGRFRPVGARTDSLSDFRLVAATNEPVSRLVRLGRFREDLSFRLGGVVVVVPPLRDRIDDVPILAAHFAERFAEGRELAANLLPEAMSALQEHDWPGNVRELKHAVERTIALADGPQITAADVHKRIDGRAALAHGGAHHDTRGARLRELLASVGWDTSKAATLLDVDRTTVYRRMKRLGISAPLRGFEPEPEPGNWQVR